MNNKSEYVRKLFASIAPTYDFLNTFLSFNRDAKWRKKVIQEADLPENGYVLDLCTGTGKLAFAFFEKSPAKLVVGLDFCNEMLTIAKAVEIRNPKSEIRNKIYFIQADAVDIPFSDNTFDCITIAFGLRNVPDLPKLFNEMRRVTKPGGKMLALELTRPNNKIVYLFYYAYLHWYLPLLGRLISKNRTAYSYLATTISEFYNREQVKQIIMDSGWTKVNQISLSTGITTIYMGLK
jgi:demethylmenaquinone methyltransferase/2-methoxy-6-polyprenyl-1,4-benzoquinol methylase